MPGTLAADLEIRPRLSLYEPPLPRFSREHRIVGYPTRCRAPWTNGRSEREHREVRGWLLKAERTRLSDAEFDADLAEGLLMLNFVKPRAVLGFRRSAEVYFRDPGLAGIDRDRFIAELEQEKRRLGGRGDVDSEPG